LLPSLDLGLSFGSSPTVFMLKPGLDWFLPVPGGIVPFVGVYYAHWFVSGGYLPQDAWGGAGRLLLRVDGTGDLPGRDRVRAGLHELHRNLRLLGATGRSRLRALITLAGRKEFFPS